MYRHGTEGLDAYVDALLEPLWAGLSDSHPTKTPAELLTERLEEACERLERSADRWENS
jgi:hypothetical protein